MGRRGRHSANTRIETASGCVEFVSDGPRLSLFIDGRPQSCVDLTDATYLSFGYMEWIDRALALTGGLKDREVALHLGGGACALPRAWAHRYPQARQVVAEIDPDVVDLVRATIDLPKKPTLSLRVQDGALALAQARDGWARVLVRDAFDHGATPAPLSGADFWRHAARVTSGIAAANCACGPAPARAEATSAARFFPHIALVATARTLAARKAGNVVVLASHEALPVADLARELTRCREQAIVDTVETGG